MSTFNILCDTCNDIERMSNSLKNIEDLLKVGEFDRFGFRILAVGKSSSLYTLTALIYDNHKDELIIAPEFHVISASKSNDRDEFFNNIGWHWGSYWTNKPREIKRCIKSFRGQTQHLFYTDLEFCQLEKMTERN